LEFITGKLKISNISKTEIITQLEQRSYPKLGIDENFGKYEYLIKMPIYNLTKNKIEELKAKQGRLETEITTLQGYTILDLWLIDLKDFTKQYKKIYTIKKKTKKKTKK
jgi:hypothetical protein